MNIYDVYFRDGTSERRTLMFMGPVPSGYRVMKKLQETTGRKDIVKITRPLAGDKVVWEATNG